MTNGKNKKLAVFDIDGTVFRSSLLVELVNALVESGIFPSRARAELEKDYLAWLNREGDYGRFINKAVDIFLKHIAGCKEKAVLDTARRMLSHQKNRLYRFTRGLIADCRRKKMAMLCISGSPLHIVSLFAREAGFEDFFGSDYEVKKGTFTGKVLNLDILFKKDIILQNYIKQKKIEADLKGSLAVGDTENDIPLLGMVGRPIAFNPNMPLAVHAKKKGWQIVVERKDVIYSLGQFGLAGEKSFRAKPARAE